jgi:DNA-directed RNA polymerase subunit RPC12/RpoP
MGTRGVCPRCSARISPWGVLRMSRRTPYRCPSCGGNAVIAPRSGMGAVVVYVAVLAIPLFALDYLGVPRVALFAACVAAVVAIPIVFARICRFEARIHDMRQSNHDA